MRDAIASASAVAAALLLAGCAAGPFDWLFGSKPPPPTPLPPIAAPADGRVVGAAAALLPAGGAAGPFDGLFGSKPPPPTPLQPIATPIEVRVVWQASVGRGAGAVFTPAPAGGPGGAAAPPR